MVNRFLLAFCRKLAVIPPGHVLVPITPTLPMIQAGHAAAREGVTGVWRAMLEATPKHQEHRHG